MSLPAGYAGNPTDLAAWKALAAHAEQINGITLREHFAADPTRG